MENLQKKLFSKNFVIDYTSEWPLMKDRVEKAKRKFSKTKKAQNILITPVTFHDEVVDCRQNWLFYFTN